MASEDRYRGYLRVDFHVHTKSSPDSLTSASKMIQTARRRGIDRVVVTDHNKIDEAYLAKDLDSELIIVGEEIETTAGEILAAFMTEEIPPGLPPMEVITRLRAQKAFISISHPFDPLRKGGWNREALLEILPFIDAIETFNARCLRPVYNWRATTFAREHGIPGTHGSDAHAAFEIGRGSLLVPKFQDAKSLQKSIKAAISPRLFLSAPWVHFTSRYATWVKKRRNRNR
jgi:predicted metal-dependent phosphoesterase TrpH